jgi:hypothetical protein
MPDGLVNSSSNFIQVVDQGHDDTQLSVASGCTVVFDSYSPEHEVRRRNLKRNNASKLNHMPSNRFSADFNVRIRTDGVAAILCAETVSDYRVVDKKKSDQTITTAIIDKQSDYVKTPHEISAKRMRRPEPSLETNALIECVDSEQTYYFSSSAPCTTAPPLRKALTGNEEARQHYHTTTPYPISFGHPGFPSCLLDAAGTLCPPVYNLPVDGYHDNFKHLVEAADKKSYKETVGIMNFISSSSSPLLSSTGLNERGARPSPPSNGQQPIFNVNNMMLFESLLGASDNIQALVSANDTPSSKDARMLVDIPGLIDSFKTTLQGKPTDEKKVAAAKSSSGT